MAALSTLLATWFGSGYSPKAPGTVGSLAALPLVWLLMHFSGAPAVLGFAIVISLIGWWATESYTRRTGRHDPSEAVIDEVAGQSLTCGLAFLFIPPSGLAYGLAFALFRLLDIVKRGPVGWADRSISGGLGIMVDDLVAGLLAAVALVAIMMGVKAL